MTKLEEAFQKLWETEFKDTEKSADCHKKESERDIACSSPTEMPPPHGVAQPLCP